MKRTRQRQRIFAPSFARCIAAAVLLSGAFLTVMPAHGQVVIDMPPPPRAAGGNEQTSSEAAERPLDQADNAADDAEYPTDETTPAKEDSQEGDVDAARTAKPSQSIVVHTQPPPRAGQRPADEPGRLALARYAGARQYARPHDAYAYWGYQPRGRGVGPWGLGHPWVWYGNFQPVAPAVFIGGRGSRLFW